MTSAIRRFTNHIVNVKHNAKNSTMFRSPISSLPENNFVVRRTELKSASTAGDDTAIDIPDNYCFNISNLNNKILTDICRHWPIGQMAALLQSSHSSPDLHAFFEATNLY
jgi:hypothetical protein